MVTRDSVTKHEQCAAIERDLCIGIPLRQLARKYGVSKDALLRHKKKLPPQLKAAMWAGSLKPGVDLDKLRITESEGLLSHLASQRARLLMWQDAAASSEQFSVAAQIASQINANLALTGRYLGELGTHHTVTSISVLLSPEYLTLRSALLKALTPFLEARAAVAEALRKVESEAARRTEVQALPAPEVINVGN